MYFDFVRAAPECSFVVCFSLPPGETNVELVKPDLTPPGTFGPETVHGNGWWPTSLSHTQQG